ncbi:hypothetical protein M3194_28905 [Paenibacillus glycanilyticus]|uniref:YciC family protein n=1 Tax=Paenibacillus glycanilyticus TaxID=126569 RepID=UPI00203B7AC6|nr:YciC family protein [Paenibacillus glycanilyticus]MCM3631327.1 hypothetical protein [Paenibacillus glycanilyticus]
MIPAMTNLPEIRPSKGGGVLGMTFSLFIKNAGALLLLTAITSVPIQLIAYYSFSYVPSSSGYSVRDILISMLFITLLTPVVVHFLIGRLQGSKGSITDAYRWGLRKWPRMIMYSFLQSVILTAGFLLFIIPGFFMYVRLLLLPVVVSVENTSVTNPLESSRNMAKGQFWAFIGYSVVIQGALFLITWSAGKLFMEAAYSNGITVALYNLFIDWISILGTILSLVLYLKLRTEQHAATAKAADEAAATV